MSNNEYNGTRAGLECKRDSPAERLVQMHIQLFAKKDCKLCKGRGEVQEPHGEVLDCDCIYDQSTYTDEQIDEAIAKGTIEIVSAYWEGK